MASVEELEKRIERLQQDHDTLIRVDENVKTLMREATTASIEYMRQLATLDGRTIATDRRVDRIETTALAAARTARILGAVTGAVIGSITGFILALVTILYYLKSLHP